MINQKSHDWVLNVLSNPSFSTSDFKDVGLDADNTSLLQEDVYKRSNKILENPLFKGEDGQFDNAKFHKFYQTAEYMYNMLSNETYLEKSAEEAVVYGKDDIFAPRKQRRTFEDTVSYTKIPNPDRLTTGLIRIGETSTPSYSDEEIAQTQKVLNNPVEASKDPSKAEWHDAPNDSWFTDFWDTRVLAQWEEDGTHVDPITGQTIQHQKGQLKLNENGTYYYENLDGRDVYGKRVLNKMNTLTVDDSYWNKYDFFDSDDLEQKSIGGTIMKNLALVGTMFIPYVGPVVAGTSVATQLMGLTGTLGKMLLGSESPTFSALEGWSKSVNRQTAKSMYAQQNTWCWENFISLIGDVAGQLKEQRFLFDYAPALIKGTKVVGANGISTLKQEKLAEQFANTYKKKISATLADLEKEGSLDLVTLKQFQEALKFATVEGRGKLDNFMKSYYKLGEIISKGYMTAITVGDTYGEAKYYGGATDTEAAFLTIGYAALEATLLNTDIGNWILPELKNSGIKNKKIIEAITKNVPKEMREESVNVANKEAKQNFAKYWFNVGKKLAQDLSVTGKSLTGQAISGGLGEGFEETAEELLSDFSKSCFNAVQWLQGDDNRMSAWDNMLDRYSMSFIGGAVGGGLTAIGTDFKENNKDVSYEQAIQELVYKSRNNELQDLYKTIDKMTIGNKYVQGEFDREAGQIKFKPATDDSSNFDTEIKSVIKHQIQLIDDLIKTEGLKYTDNKFISKQTFNDIRLGNLANSPVTSSYLQDFNTLSTKIIDIKNRMNKIKDKDQKTLSDQEQTDYNNLNKELLDLKLQQSKYINGEYAMDYIGKSLLSMSPIFSKYFTKAFFKDYAETVEKKAFNKISESRLKQLKEDFKAWKATGFKDHVSTMAPLYLTMARNFGEYVANYAKYYDSIRNNTTIKDLQSKQAQANNQLLGPLNENNLIISDDQNEWVKKLEHHVKRQDAQTLVQLLLNKGNENERQELTNLIKHGESLISSKDTPKEEVEKIETKINDFIIEKVLNNLEYYYEDFIKAGSINPEIKQSLLHTLEGLQKQQDGNLKSLYYVSSIDNLNQLIDWNSQVFPPTYLESINDSIEEMTKQLDEQDFDIDYLNTLAKQVGFRELTTVGDLINLRSAIVSRQEKLDKVKKAIKESTYTDTIQFIADFIQTNSDSKLDIFKLIEQIQGIFQDNKEDLSSANLQQFKEQIEEAIEVIGWLQGLTLGAQYDAKASLDNMMGYNQAMNEIAKTHHAKDWKPLFTINQDTANIINQDLELVKTKLIQAKNLRFINEGKKLTLQDRVATNKKYIDFNRLVKWIVNIDDSWVGKEKIQQAIDDAKLLNANAKDRKQLVLNIDQQVQLEQETLAIDESLYEFFEANKDKIAKGELKNLFKKDFDFWSDSNQLLNEGTESLNDKNFFWQLAARAAVNRRKFVSNFNEIISPEVAPLPSQEEAVYINVANTLNNNVFKTFRNAFIQAAQEEFNNSTDKEGIVRKFRPNISNADLKETIKEGNVANWRVIPFYDITLVEGIPGAGKSEAVNYYTAKILQSIPEITKNIWYAHNNVVGAEKAINKLGIKAKAFNHNTLMKQFFSEYNTSRPKDNKGNLIYTEDEWIKDSEGNWKIKYKVDALSNPPSLIIIDEISHYDEADLQLLQDLHDKYGTHIMTSGDFDQSSLEAVVQDKTGQQILKAPSYRGKFMYSPKLGVSMRTSNSQMDKTVTDYQTWLQLDENLQSATSRNFYYYEGEEGLNGVKQIEASQKVIKENIEKLLKTLKEGEKIGFIYYDDNSQNYKDIIRDYGDKIEPFKGTAAQGFEGQYYIIDASTIPSKKDLYTAITRSSQGVLIINKLPGINSIKESVTSISDYKDDLIKYFNKRKQIISKLNLKKEELQYIPPTSKIIPPEIKGNDVDVPETVVPKEISWDGAVKEFYIDKIRYYTDGKTVAKQVDAVTIEEIEPTNPIYNEVIEQFNNENLDTIPLDNENTDPSNNEKDLNSQVSESPEKKVIDEGPKLFRYLFHSHNSFELGVGENENGTVKWFGDKERYKFRFDSVIGLLKLYHEKDWFETPYNIQQYKTILGELRGLLFDIPDKDSLAKSISNLLSFYAESFEGEDIKVENIEFGLTSAPLVSNKNRNPTNGSTPQNWGYADPAKARIFSALDKSYQERTVNGTVDNSLNRKTITATISFTNGKRLAIPLFVLGNLKTYATNPKNKVSKRLKELCDKYDSEYDLTNAILKDDVLKNVPEIVNLAKLFQFTSAGYFKITDDTWTPAKNLQNWGIQVVTEASSSGTKEFKATEDTPISDILESNSEIFASEKIYTSLQPIEDIHGNRKYISHRGHPFILVAQDPRLKGQEEEMKEIYKNQLLNPSLPKRVTLVYLTPPKVPMETYVDNLYKIIKETDQDKRKGIKLLGNHLTSYYNWEALLPALEDKSSKIFTKLTEDARLFLIDKIKEIQASDDKLSIALSTETWPPLVTGQPETQSVQNHLNYLFLSMFTKFGENGGIDETAKKEVIEALKENGRDFIYYSPRFKNKIPENNQEFIPILQDEDGSYSIDGLPFTLKAKLDSSMFSLDNDFNSIIEGWVSKITHAEGSGVKQSTDTIGYLNGGKQKAGNVKIFTSETTGTEYTFEKQADGTVLVNKNKSSIKDWDTLQKFLKDYTISNCKTSIKQAIGTGFDELVNEVANKYYDLVLEDFINATNKAKEFLYKKVSEYVQKVNKEANNIIIYPSQQNQNTVLKQLKFPQKELEAIGGSISLDTSFDSFDQSLNSQEFKINDEVILKIDYADNTAVIEKISPDVETDDETYYAETYYELGKPIEQYEEPNKLQNIWKAMSNMEAEEIFNNDLINELEDYADGHISNLKNDKAVIKALEGLISNSNSENTNKKDVDEIQKLINYLKGDNTQNYCTITIKSMK